LDYGILNRHGVTKKYGIDRILQFASDNNIRTYMVIIFQTLFLVSLLSLWIWFVGLSLC